MRVLIVESNEQSRKEIAKFYSSDEIIMVDSAFLALKLLSMNTFDVVVTDLNIATIEDFYKQVKQLSNAKMLCSSEVGLIGTPTYNTGHNIERQQLRMIN